MKKREWKYSMNPDLAAYNILEELEAHDWNITQTAKCLNVSRETLYKYMKRYRIEKPAPEQLDERVLIAIDSNLKASAQAYADAKKISLSELIRQALSEKIS